MASGFKTRLVVEKVRGRSHKYRLVEPLVFYYAPDNRTITAPIGFLTDLSTYWIEGKHTEAAVIHDYLIVYSSGVGRGYADKVMREAMECLGVRWWHKGIVYVAVRLYGRLVG